MNSNLNRLGYAVVKIGNNKQMPNRWHDGTKYAYDNLVMVDVLAPWLVDQQFLRVWSVASKKTLADIYRSYELYQCVHETALISGDILEIGVWRGGTGVVLAAAGQRWKPDARVWLCDTFSGVVKASALDPVYVGGEHADTSVEM